MYTCRKCNTSVDESNRFCTGCGAYIGEPAVKTDNWETANNYEEFKTKKENTEVALGNNETEDSNDISRTAVKYINKDSSSLFLFVKHPEAVIGIHLDNPSLISTIKITALILFLIPLLLILITKTYLAVPNDLVDIILPLKLLQIDFKGMLNLPGSLARGFIFSFLGFASTATILFTTLYFLSRLILKTEINVLRIWKAIMLSYVVYAFSLAVFFSMSFISRTLGNILLLGGMIFWLITLHNAVKAAVINIEDKAGIVTAASLMLSYVTVYVYLYYFLRWGEIQYD